LAATIYFLCAFTAALCALQLLLAYRRGRYRLLLWSGLCFAGLSINNAILVLDKVIFPAIDLSVPRTLVALLSMIILLYGLIWEAE
jgi:hypothetical protein